MLTQNEATRKVWECFIEIEKNGENEISDLLISFVASLVHPDYVTNLAMLSGLPEPTRNAVRLAFMRAHEEEFTQTERTEIYKALLPLMPRLIFS